MKYIRWLNSLASKEYPKKKPEIEGVKKLLAKLDNPQDIFPSIHLAGTNGKGSTARTVFEILRKSGYKTGLYTSPHLVNFNERIRINDRFISNREVSEIIKKYIFSDTPDLTYFEIMTVIAFVYFSIKKVDIAVVEVGLGGRYDATNVLNNVAVSIITPVDYDHTEFLGKSITDIAGEKAGIVKKGVPVVSAVQNRSVEKIVRTAAIAQSCDLYILGKDFQYKKGKTDWLNLKQVFSYEEPGYVYSNIRLNLLGEHQLANVSVALKCVTLLKGKGFFINSDSIYAALEEVFWPARFDTRKIKFNKKKLTVIIDGAHNPDGIKALVETLKGCGLFKDKITIAMSVMKEKAYPLMVELLSAVAKKVILYKSHNKRALDTGVLTEEWGKFLPRDRVSTVNSIREMFWKINGEKIFCLTGSLYFAGEFIEYINGKVSR